MTGYRYPQQRELDGVVYDLAFQPEDLIYIRDELELDKQDVLVTTYPKSGTLSDTSHGRHTHHVHGIVTRSFIIFVSCWSPGICFTYAIICILNLVLLINSLLWPSDTIWRQRSGSTLAPVMACCLTAPSHYLNQC